MRNLHYLEDSALIDMLAEYTLKFTHLFRLYKGIHPSREYKDYKKKIDKIIAELDQRGMMLKKDGSLIQNERALLLHERE